MPKALHPLQIIDRPLITEKGTRLIGEDKYLFAVHLRANKHQIKEAVEIAFNVKVASVNVMIMKEKQRKTRTGRLTLGKTWKKAVVTLEEGHKLELFEGV